VVDAAEDGVYGDFCRQIGVANIREYEVRQLKLAQEETEARLRFETQIARLTHLYVFRSHRPQATDPILLKVPVRGRAAEQAAGASERAR
jgi:structural maintenance of chromosome 1